MDSHVRADGPAPVVRWRERDVAHARARIVTYEAGRSDAAAPVVVLVHGIGHWVRAAWDGVVPHLATTHRIVAFDLPGFGRSEKPDVSYALAYFRAALEAVIAATVPDSFALVGHSLGGMIAADYAGRNPDRVRALGLIDPAGFLRTPTLALRVVAALPFASVLARMRPPRAFVRRTLHAAVADSRVIAPDVEARAFELARDPALVRAFARVYRGALTEFVRLDRLHRTFATWRGPTLLVWGNEDRFIPVRALARARTVYPQADVLVLSPCGHCPNVEYPATVVARLRATGV